MVRRKTLSEESCEPEIAELQAAFSTASPQLLRHTVSARQARQYRRPPRSSCAAAAKELPHGGVPHEGQQLDQFRELQFGGTRANFLPRLAPLDGLMIDYRSPKATALITDISLKTLEKWRSERRGPPFYRIGKRIRYRLDEVMAWIESDKEQCSRD